MQGLHHGEGHEPQPLDQPQARVNFVAKFDIDEGATTDLSLDAAEYDPSPSADYQSWLLIEDEPPEEEGEGRDEPDIPQLSRPTSPVPAPASRRRGSRTRRAYTVRGTAFRAVPNGEARNAVLE